MDFQQDTSQYIIVVTYDLIHQEASSVEVTHRTDGYSVLNRLKLLIAEETEDGVTE